MFDVIPVDPALAETLEPLGTKRKYWYRRDGRRMLFKAEERGTGEDWAEKVACELCRVMGLPHVHYELAEEQGTAKPGMVCESCVARPADLALGNQVLLSIDPKYPANEANKYKVRAHTLDAVTTAMAYLTPPSWEWMAEVPLGITSALDVFLGYVLLDAWIANQDRHHENWGVIVESGQVMLAPTFDHGASMARNISDEERLERMTSRDRNRQVEVFSQRAKSAFFANEAATKPMSTFEAWQAFAAMALPAADA